MKSMEEFYVPWLKGQKMYISAHIELAWRDPSLHRMMSNENPNPPSAKVLAAIDQVRPDGQPLSRPGPGRARQDRRDQRAGRAGERDARQRLERDLRQIWRSLVAPGEEVIQHTPCFGIYKLRCAAVGGKMVSVPMSLRRQAPATTIPRPSWRRSPPRPRSSSSPIRTTPPATSWMPKDFVRIAETGIPFVVDEAYVEFAGLGHVAGRPDQEVPECDHHPHPVEGLRPGGPALWLPAGRSSR